MKHNRSYRLTEIALIESQDVCLQKKIVCQAIDCDFKTPR